MSRIAKKPINIPAGITVDIKDNSVTVKGPNGTLSQDTHPNVQINKNNENILTFEPLYDSKKSIALTGTVRAVVNNMVIGVEKGFEKRLKLIGVGYRAQLQGKNLNLTLGFSHPVVHELPENVSAELPSQTEIVLKSPNKQLLGLVAADIRKYRPPEVYKGKGIRYSDEHISLKEAKKK